MSSDDIFARAMRLHQAGRLTEAETAYRRALASKPDWAMGYSNLGLVLTGLKRPADAIAAFQQSLRLSPNQVECLDNLGIALGTLGRFEEALDAHWRALKIQPEHAGAYYNAGIALKAMGRIVPAEAAWRRAIALRPNFAQAMNNLGLLLAERGLMDESVEVFRQALAVDPNSTEVLNNLSISLGSVGQIEEAIDVCKKALVIKSDFPEAHNHVGNMTLTMGGVTEALASFRKAIAALPDYAIAHSNLVFGMNFLPGCDAPAILREARRWDEQHGKPLRHLVRPHKNSRDGDRRLRVGYVSPDLRQHVVAWNLLPLLREHDRERYEIFCYASVLRPDAMTDRLREQSDHWRDVLPLSDEHLAEKIRDDGIDILIDLSLHSGNNRLRAFAIEPAPVQITYLGYCGTSGVTGMHYRFSDPYLDPPDTDLKVYSEETIRLPETYWCYSPGRATPDVSELPAKQNGCVTFGSMNQFAKVSAEAIDLWCEILKRAPESKMMVHAPFGKYLARTRERFNRNGIESDRVEFVDRQAWDAYIRTYNRIDIGLDTFPYNGGITTCDTMWMGVPVITLSGNIPVGRGGRSILSNLGLADLVGNTSDEYVDLAVKLAGDIPRLADLRRTMRDRMQNSPLMNAPRFARNVEAAYREAWRRWCARP